MAYRVKKQEKLSVGFKIKYKDFYLVTYFKLPRTHYALLNKLFIGNCDISLFFITNF